MTRIVVDRQVGGGGLLELSLPLGSGEAGRTVRITIESVGEGVGQSADDWRTGILSIAGEWQGEFERPPQGELEEREPLT